MRPATWRSSMRCASCERVPECWAVIGQSSATSFPPPMWGHVGEGTVWRAPSQITQKRLRLGLQRCVRALICAKKERPHGVEQTKARPVRRPAEPMTPLVISYSRPELFQARFDLGFGVGRIGGFDLRPQPIAAVDVGLQNFHLMVAHLIDHRSLQFDAHSRARIRDEIFEMKTVTLIVG